MSTTITVINMKGGVGKTTLSVNLAYVLSRDLDKKVLLVDIDPQFNATQYLVKQDAILDHFKNKLTIYDVLVPKKEEEISLSIGKTKKAPSPVNLNDLIIPIKDYEERFLTLRHNGLRSSPVKRELYVDKKRETVD